MNNNFDIICYGEILWDIYGDDYKEGGAPFNVSAIAKLLGLKSAIISAVGQDELGKKLEEVVAKYGVTSIIQHNKYETGKVLVTLDTEKKPIFDIKQNVAYDYIEYNKQVEEACSKSKFLCFGTLAQRSETSRSTLRNIVKRSSLTKIYDINLRKSINDWDRIVKEILKFTDILKLNDEETDVLNKLFAPSLTREKFIEFLIKEYNLQYVFITMGENGASLYTKDNKIFHEDAPGTEVVDTTGCGDAFVASIVYSFLNNHDHGKMLENAVNVSSRIAEKKGAIPNSV